MAEVLHVEQFDAVRLLTLNRPDARNALNLALASALHEALLDVDRDDTVAVAVVTGADPAFCAGLDLKEAASLGAGFFRQLSDYECITQVAKVAKPLIGAINGPAFTGGFEIALGCDFLIASERASFGDTHARVGILPGGGMTARLPQAVGLRRARQLSMTGDVLDAARAERFGLVNEVVPHDDLLPRTLEIAQTIATVDTGIMSQLGRMYAEGSLVTTGEALLLEQQIAGGWRVDFEGLAARRDSVLARNRAQLTSETR